MTQFRELEQRSQIRLLEPFCNDLDFTVAGTLTTSLDDYTITDHLLVAQCDDSDNPYAYEGRVELRMRVLPPEDGVSPDELLLFWQEEARLVDAVKMQIGKSSFSATFGDGERRNYRAVEGGNNFYTANRTSTVGTDAGKPASKVRYIVYQTTVEGEDGEYPQYLLFEQHLPGSGWTAWQGYSMSAENVLN